MLPRKHRRTDAHDPVCGAKVRPSSRTLSEEYAGTIYYFCSQACLERFSEDADIFTSDVPLGALVTRDRASRPASEYAEQSRMGEHAVVGPAPVVDAGPG
jgi:YHS domain-containing protein